VHRKETECENLDCIHLVQYSDQWRSVVNIDMNPQVLKRKGNISTS
jgi:hypothetical protein